MSRKDFLYNKDMLEVFKQDQLRAILMRTGFASSGTKTEQVGRMIAAFPLLPGEERPTKPQLVYIAAVMTRAARGQGANPNDAEARAPAIGAVTKKPAASRWLTEHGDYGG